MTDQEPSVAPAPPPEAPGAGAPASSEGRGGLVRRIGRALFWPFTRFFDPRFRGLDEHLGLTHSHLGAQLNHSIRIGDETLREAQGLRLAQPVLQASVSDGLSGVGTGVRQVSAQVEHVSARLDHVSQQIALEVEAAAETTTLIGRSLADLQDLAAQIQEDAAAASDAAQRAADASLEARHRTEQRFARLASEGSVDDLDPEAARFLTYASGHLGPSSQAGLWFNPPVAVGYRPREVFVLGVNERIVEQPYVFGAVARLAAGARVLDVGSSESTVALSLASLGYRVTALDPRRYPLEHPLLEVSTEPIERFRSGQPFDAVVSLSTIEHVGLFGYGVDSEGDEADLAAMERIRALLRPGGLFVLTLPLGPGAADPPTRPYDAARLDRLLAGFAVEDRRFAVRTGPLTWERTDDPGDASENDTVALVTARLAPA